MDSNNNISVINKEQPKWQDDLDKFPPKDNSESSAYEKLKKITHKSNCRLASLSLSIGLNFACIQLSKDYPIIAAINISTFALLSFFHISETSKETDLIAKLNKKG